MPGIDRQLGCAQNRVFLVLPGGVVILVSNHAGNITPLAHTQQHGLRGQRPFRHAAHPVNPDCAVIVDSANDESQLIHMGENHDAWGVRITLKTDDQIAKRVGAPGYPKIRKPSFDGAPHPVFMAAQPRNLHQLAQISF